MPQTRERHIESYLTKRVKDAGGEIRKVKWIGRNGAPDRRVVGKAWVELKAPGERPEPHQFREHARMRAAGEIVEVIDTFEKVDEFMMKYFQC